MMMGSRSRSPDVDKAVKLLNDAIDLHENHMNGSAPTTGDAGMKSQMKMMRMMESALEALNGPSGMLGRRAM